MKPIKFDLPINGVKVRNLQELRDNFTTDILEHYRDGLLLKWLGSRSLMAEAEKLAAIPADKSDADVLAAICIVFGVEADQQVIEAALAKASQGNGQALSLAPEELKYKEKFEELSELLERLKRNKLYLRECDYNLFVKDKLQIEHGGKVEIFAYGIGMNPELCFWFQNGLGFLRGSGGWEFLKVGNIIEVGDNIAFFRYSPRMQFSFISPYRGVVVELGDVSPERTDEFRDGEMVFCIRIDHDTSATLKVVLPDPPP